MFVAAGTDFDNGRFQKENNMWPKRLFWKLYNAFLLIIIIPALIFTWYTTRTFRKFFITTTIENLTERALQIASQMEGLPDNAEKNTIDSLCKVIAGNISMRFTVIAADGTVRGDSEKDPDSMENHANRMEVIAALSGKTGVSERFSHTLKQMMMYVAVPMNRGGKITGVVRTSISTSLIHRELISIYSRIGIGYLLVAIAAAIASFFVSRKITLSVNSMKLGARKFSAGDFGGTIAPVGCTEIDELAESLNEMSFRLHTTIDTLTEQRNQIEAVLSSMSEGVIALDNSQRIIAINQAAVSLFGLPSRPENGTWIGTVIRNAKINDFIERLIKDGSQQEEEILLTADHEHGEGSDKLLQLRGNVLRDADYNTIGVLMVINDITRIKKLETMKGDFVANVSHELRTPLTSVKGFVETLLSGEVDDKEETRRFLQIINRQVERLSTIVEDLLTLSRIEQETKAQGPQLQLTCIRSLIASVVETCSIKAAAKSIHINTVCDENLHAMVEPALIEQALINLVDNAVNYSQPSGNIEIRAGTDDKNQELFFEVSDNGPGIAPEHHERIFERFYRVDKARSRKLGGTGLGLSIVKHVAMVHNGRVSVKSEPGKGSTFYIYVPYNTKDGKGK